VLAEAVLLAALARLGTAVVEPPGAELRERSGKVLRTRRKAVAGALHEAATPASLDLQLVRECFCFRLGARLGGLTPAPPGRVGPLRVPDASALDYAGHTLRSSPAATELRMRA